MVHCRTQTYNFNVISTDSDPSFGVSNKALGSGKSPGKAHLEEVTDCGSIKRRRKPLCEQHQVKEDFLFLFFQSKHLGRFVFTFSVTTRVMIYCFPHFSQSLYYLMVCH